MDCNLTICREKLILSIFLYILNIYMYKEDLAFNNIQWLTCHKNQTKLIKMSSK